MNHNIEVGYVSQVSGRNIKVNTYEQTNNQTYYYNGKSYQGCTVGSYIGIISSQYKIIARIENEYLKDTFIDKHTNYKEVYYSLDRFEREVDVVVLGYFSRGKFTLGVKHFPQIYDKVVLLDEDEIISIHTGEIKQSDNAISIGKTVAEGINIPMEWGSLFNTHIGIFGNTGSGKSNTLTKLFTSLFDTKNLLLKDKSKFVVVDFNGEYTKEKVLSNKKKIYRLSTSKENHNIKEKDKLPINSKNFLNVEALSILFSATEQTQRPFLERMLKFYGKDILSIDAQVLIDNIIQSFVNVFIGSYKKESKNLFNSVLDYILPDKSANLHFYNLEWNGTTYDYIKPGTPNHTISEDINYLNTQAGTLKQELERHKAQLQKLTVIDKLYIYCNLQLIFGMRFGYLQFDYISPLINRIANRSIDFNKIFRISKESFYDENFLYIISLRDSNQEIKRLIPLFLVKQIYSEQKTQTKTKIKGTTHLIIDEAHNILSEKSSREASTWKDYRLETFEEIIKEGRKFGFYLTISSQRPNDISPTIISQLHNYFIHRLVNDQDLYMIDNTISSLDRVSKDMIPTLAPGQAVITGTSFNLPQIIYVELLEKDYQPRSESANLEELWLEK